MGWLALAADARAQAARAHFSLERPAQSFCPTSQAIERDVEALAGRPIFTRDPRAPVQVHCDIVDRASGATARIEVRGADGTALGTRELSSGPGECGALREPIAVVLLMLLDREIDDAHPSAAPRGDGSGPRFGYGASTGALIGALPRPDPGIGLALASQIGARLFARMDAHYWFPVTARVFDGPGGRFRAFSLAGSLCARFSNSPPAVGAALCGGAQLTILQASALELLESRRGARAFGQAFLTLALTGKWRRGELVADLGPTLAFARPRFYLLRGDRSELEVHRPALLGAIFRLSLIIWPR